MIVLIRLSARRGNRLVYWCVDRLSGLCSISDDIEWHRYLRSYKMQSIYLLEYMRWSFGKMKRLQWIGVCGILYVVYQGLLYYFGSHFCPYSTYFASWQYPYFFILKGPGGSVKGIWQECLGREFCLKRLIINMNMIYHSNYFWGEQP